MKWEKRGFSEFSRGIPGNGGQNIYVSANGVLQRIHNFDVNGDGYPDLFFANSQSMGERPPVYVYSSPLDSGEYFELPSGGSYDAVMADLNGDGYDDLVIACQNNGTHTDITAYVYFGSENGLTEKYRMELPAPDATGVAAGDFNGDGRTDLAFICNEFIRIFYQDQKGILPYNYEDLRLDAVSIAVADIDKDGYVDLCFKSSNGSTGVLWGGAGGISLGRITWLVQSDQKDNSGMATTPLRRKAYRGWRTNIITLNGRVFLFYVKGDSISFACCGQGRSFETAFELHCPGAVGVCAGDLDGDGYDDIAVAVCTDKNLDERSMVFWGGEDGFDLQKASGFVTVSAQSLLIDDLNGDGRLQLIVCQGGTSIVYSTESMILGFGRERLPTLLAKLKSGDAMRIVAGRTGKKKGKQVVVINHETGRVRGDENIYIYLGGPDGYRPGRRVELPGFAAVDGAMLDFNDDGYTDVLVVNCSENAPHLDPGCFLYLGGPEGFDRERRITIPSVRAHGAAVGDFRKSGYLDIAVGGFRNREILVFKGGPNGPGIEAPQKIVLGPEPESYAPEMPKTEDEAAFLFGRADKSNTEYGEVRWIFTADFNGDGWLDLFVSEITGRCSYILWGGPEGFSMSRMSSLATECVAFANAADLDNDGYLDLVLAGHKALGKNNAFESYVTIYWGGPDGYQEYRRTQLPVTCANSVAIGDFNGDGILDIYATSYNNGRCRDLVSYLYFGGKGGIFSVNHFKLLFNHSGSGCTAGDFNGDGYTDLAVACHKGYGDHAFESFVFWGGPDGLSDDRKAVLPTLGPHGMTTVHPGNIMDRSDVEYYYSEIYKVPEGFMAAKAYWEAELPEKTYVQMQIRHAADEKGVEAGPWQGLGNSNFIENGQELLSLRLKDGYIQYRLMLGAKCSCGTPRVRSVVVEFI